MFFALFSASACFNRWPPKYTLRGTWKVPYTNLSNTLLVVQEPDRQYYNQGGVLQVWNTGPADRIHRKIVVADNQSICYGYPTTGEWDIELTQFLPDPDGFVQQPGTYAYNGQLCDLWVKTASTAKTQTWKVYINKAGSPVAYVSTAISIFHSHYDVYVLEVDEFIEDVLPGAWNIPTQCNNAPDDPYPGSQFNLFFPSKRTDALSKNYESISSSNLSYKVGPTHYAHMDSHQWLKTIRRHRHNRASNDISDICSTYQYEGDVTLPTEFSWRNYSGVVGKPRDQVACGSCWAFGTAELLESQFAIKNGIFREVSTNQIMDCTWDNGNDGCQGGEVGPTLTSLIRQNAKIATEKEYPYIGLSGFCERDTENPIGKIVDCFHVERTRKAVKEALYKFGPLAISIHVVEGMSLYVGGVFQDSTCTGIDDELDHIVLLTGWKVIEDKEAWEVKNSWSTYWGDNGYIYIQTDDQETNCGVTTRAVGVVVEPIQK